MNEKSIPVALSPCVRIFLEILSDEAIGHAPALKDQINEELAFFKQTKEAAA